jgi:Mor family transcriptional regulator
LNKEMTSDLDKQRPRLQPFTPEPHEAVLPDDLGRIASLIEAQAPGKGKALTVQIAKEFAGTYVYFMQQDKLFRATRDHWIIRQYEAGYRASEIARAASLSERQIWNILGREPDDDRQLRLF